MIPCSNPHASYLAHQQEIDSAVRRVLGSGHYILGPEVEAFEREFADYIGAEHAIGVASGTDAIHLALRACGIGAGDEVICPSFTAVATVAAIELSGATPVLVDIHPASHTLDPDRLAAAITERTRALVPVHLFGQEAFMPKICELALERGLRVIEDCSQAHGTRSVRGGWVGAYDVGCFSCYPTKNLGALGDAGIVTTRDVWTADGVRALRQYGWDAERESLASGTNSRLDELQAAVLRVKLRHLDDDLVKRRRIADTYDDALGLLTSFPQHYSARHLYVIREPRRVELIEHLRAREIQAGIHYPKAVHEHAAYRHLVRCPLPESERAAREVVSLPLYPELKPSEVERVIRAVKEFRS